MGRHHEVMATILWTGSLETDGCDWVIKIGNDFYHPDSLSQVFRRDQLEVFVSYETPTGTFVCGLVEQGYPIITITSIRNL